MKRNFWYSTGFAVVALSLPAPADTIYSNLQDIAIPTDFTGVFIDVTAGVVAEDGSWDVNPFFGGVGVANSPTFQPYRTGTGNTANIVNLAKGSTIDASLLYLSSGWGGSAYNVGAGKFTAGTEGYIGFKLDDANYGWMRVVFTGNADGALVKDWAYDNSGAPIVVGQILQSTVNGTPTVVLATGSGVTTTLASPISGDVSVLQSGEGTTILGGGSANTFTGLTKVSAGQLELGKAAGTNAVGGNVTVSGGTLKWLANEQMGNGAALTLTSGGTVNLNGMTETVGTFSNSGGAFSTGTGTLIGTGSTVTWSGGTNTINDGGLVQDSHIIISGGTNTVEGGATGGVLQLATGGTGLWLSNGSTLTLNSDAATAGKLLLQGNVDASGSTTVTIANGGSDTNKGTIDLGNGTRTFEIADGDGGAGTDMLISAKITNGGLTKEGLGTLALSGANTYTGLTTVNGGVLLVDGSIAGAVTVGPAAAALGGIGSIAGAVTVNGNGTLEPGDTNSIGRLTTGATTFNGGSTFAYDLNSNTQTADLLIAGALSLNGSVKLSLNYVAGGSFGENKTLSLINYTGALSGGFFTYNGSPLAEGGEVTLDGTTWRIVYGATTGGLNAVGLTGNFINLTNGSLASVPEPGSLLALGCLVGSGAFLRNRRRK